MSQHPLREAGPPTDGPVPPARWSPMPGAEPRALPEQGGPSVDAPSAPGAPDAPAEGRATAVSTPRNGLVGGVSAGLAMRTGAPVTLVRLAWVAAALLLAAAIHPIVALIVIAAYGVVWWSASRAQGGDPPAVATGPMHDGARRTSQEVRSAAERVRQQVVSSARAAATAPAPDAPAAGSQLWGPRSDATAAQETARPAAARSAPPIKRSGDLHEERPYLKDFVAYLWSAQTTPKQVYKFSAHGVVLSDLPIPKEKMTVWLRLARMPYGRIVVWPGWLVFMTESHNRPGELPPANRLWSVLLDFIREYRRYTSLLSLARTSYQVMTKEQRDRFRGMLANPNVIVVPLHTVRDFHQERSLGSPRIVIRTDDREIMFGPNGNLEILTSFWRLIAGVVGAWHPRFQKLLSDAVRTSQQRSQQT